MSVAVVDKQWTLLFRCQMWVSWQSPLLGKHKGAIVLGKTWSILECVTEPRHLQLLSCWSSDGIWVKTVLTFAENPRCWPSVYATRDKEIWLITLSLSENCKLSDFNESNFPHTAPIYTLIGMRKKKCVTEKCKVRILSPVALHVLLIWLLSATFQSGPLSFINRWGYFHTVVSLL